MFRTDRLALHSGGGVCILTNNNSLQAISVPLSPAYTLLELCVIDIVLSDIKTRLFVCYRPPCSNNKDSASVQYIADLCNCITSLFPPNGSIIVCGDFNLPNINWSTCNSAHCSKDSCSGVFLDFYCSFGMHQLVTEPTRLDHILDLVLCSDFGRVLNTRCVTPFSTSDHSSVCFDLVCETPLREQTFSAYDFQRADWSGVKSYLNIIDFFEILLNDISPADNIAAFYRVIYAAIDLYVPVKRTLISARSHVVKYPIGIRRRLRKKAMAWSIYRSLRTPESLASYKKRASECKSAIYAYELNRENQLITNGNTGAFFRYANKNFRAKPAVGPLCTTDGSIITDPTEKAVILQSTFFQNYTADNGVLPSLHTFDKPPSKLSYIHFSPSLVRRAIKRLSVRTKGGPDGIPPTFFINCCDELCSPLSLLFSLCFDKCIMPPVWLLSYITPIFKKGNAATANNYRPIALTATMSKLMETIIKDQIVQFFVNKGIINKNQHAFIKKHSTASNLMECIHDWQVGLNSHQQTDVVYIDFSKAFDSIVHSKLLFKLGLYGIDGPLLKWIEIFLANRMQCVVTDYCFSPFCNVISGVPQGSVLGPILFLIYVNDLSTVCCGNTVLQLFADDAKLYSNISINDGTVSLQQSLIKLSQWARDWQLTINTSKCLVISVATHPKPVHDVYYIDDSPVPRQNSTIDLGVTICSDLSFETHINNIVFKARQRVGVLFRGFLTRNINVMRRAFTVYIRPILEYNSIVWNPSLIHLTELLESVQHNFTKRIPSISSRSYPERLATMDLELLELRRLRFDLVYCYKIFNDLTPFDPNKVFLIYTPIASSRSNLPYLQKPAKAGNKFLSLLYYRCAEAWNTLPASLRLSSSLPTFKRGLKNIDLSRFLKGSGV